MTHIAPQKLSPLWYCTSSSSSSPPTIQTEQYSMYYYHSTTRMLSCSSLVCWCWAPAMLLLLMIITRAAETACGAAAQATNTAAVAGRHHSTTTRNQRTVHERLFHALNYQPEFENTTWSVKMMRMMRMASSSTAGAAAGVTATASRRRQTEDDESSSTSNTRSTTASKTPPPLLTLNQARLIHQFAMEATHGVLRSHGHVVVGDGDGSSSCRRRSSSSSSTSSSRLFFPVDYGADPTGVQDSTEAFARLMQDFLQPPNSNYRPMSANITNLGGATLDLQGGTYLLSQPLVIPPMYGNAHILDGTLQASPTFPSNNTSNPRFLIEIGENSDAEVDPKKYKCLPVLPNGKTDPQASCNEFIDVTRVLIDANFVAAGGIQVSHVMGTTLTEVFVTGFLQVGILIQNGHEVMISNAWLAECYWSKNDWCKQKTQPSSRSVGIRVDGMDHYLNNIIVFDFAKVGVEIWKPANLLEGVHTWNGGGMGIVVGRDAHYTTHTVRLLGCYLDFASLNIWDPSNVLVESTFFYNAHAVLHAGDQKRVDGLTMRFNHYSTNQSVVLDGTFDHIKSVSIQEEVEWVKTTKASRVLTLTNATEWRFSFENELLFPNMPIDYVSYSLASSSPTVVSHFARPPNGTSVMVVTSEPIDATVYMTVEQGNNY